ncbi:MAG TPA: hypothetical protein VN893_03530 [Bryobacteraceae bacterium]|nr:hypothetical protein [Bryobacteraceae bacterium]
MHRFQFRLGSVLGWRAVELELEEGRLEQLFTELRHRDAEALALQVRGRESAQLIAAKTLDGQQLAALSYHRHYLEREAARLAAQRADCSKRIAAQQQRVVEAERKVRLLERLKQRRLAEWTFEFNREMEALASETFLAKWAREKGR